MVQQGVQGWTHSTASLKEWAQSRVGILCFNDKTLDQGRLYMEYACVISPLRETDTLGLARTMSGATVMPVLLPVERDVRRPDKFRLPAIRTLPPAPALCACVPVPTVCYLTCSHFLRHAGPLPWCAHSTLCRSSSLADNPPRTPNRCAASPPTTAPCTRLHSRRTISLRRPTTPRN